MGIKVSIIIPVYNVARFLRRCLDSCINQTLKEIEIIVVNDASPDQSDNIMQEYEKKYPEKIKCIYLTENVRQGGARNVAIRVAKGKYLTFVDGDDWINKNMCEELYKEAEKTQSDIVYCNELRQRKEDYIISNRFPNEAVGNVSEHVLGIITQPYVGPCGSIVKKDIIINNDLFFPEKLAGEDTAITKLWDLYAEKITKIDGAYYTYCLNMNSTSQAKETVYRNDEFECIKILYNNLMACNKVDNFHMECKLVCMRYMFNVAENKLKKEEGKFKEEVREGLMDCIHYIYGELIEHPLLEFLFTPKEKEALFIGKSINFRQEISQKEVIEDYRQYYKKLEKEITQVIAGFRKKGKTKVAVWSKTNYAIGFREAFEEIKIVDNLMEVEENKIEVVICLRMLHTENVKSQLYGKKIEVFNLQGYLWAGGRVKK